MRRLLLLTAIILLLAALFAVGLLRSAQMLLQQDADIIFTTDPITISDVRESAVVFSSGAITLDSSATIQSDAALIAWGAETVVVDGRVEGDLTVWAGNIVIGEGAVIDGDVLLTGESVSIGGVIGGDLVTSSSQLTIEPSADIAGSFDVCEVSAQVIDARLNADLVSCPEQTFMPLIGFATLMVGLSVITTGLSMLAVTVFPHRLARMEDAIKQRLGRAFGLGGAVFALVIGVTVAVLFLLEAAPGVGFVALLLHVTIVLLLLLLSLSGVSAMTLVLGVNILRWLRLQGPPLVAALLGSLAVGLPLSLLAVLPNTWGISLLLLSALLMVGFGIAIDSRLGTRGHSQRYFVQG